MATEQGPAMIADVEAGWFTDLEKYASEVVSYKEEIHSIPENVEKYSSKLILLLA